MFVWHHHSLLTTQYFSHYLWATYLSPSTAFFFLLQYPNSPNLVKKKMKKKRRRNPEQTELVKEKEEKEKKKKREPNSQPRRRKGKKKVKRWSKVAAKYCLWVLYVCLITIFPLSYELWKLKTTKMCFQFP